MKHKELKLCSLLLFALLLQGLQAQSVYVVNKSGGQTGYPLAGLRTITFSGTTLNINKKDGSTVPSSIVDIRFLSFSPLTAITNPEISNGNFEIYPNPVHDRLNLIFSKDDNIQTAEISVIGIDGKVVYSGHLHEQSKAEYQLNTTNWSNGIYILRLNNGNRLITKKIIKN